jgi:hypothetical protein
MHKVYRGRFTTLRGTERAYVGTTRCIEVREGFWRADPPGFKKAASVAEGFAVEVLEAGIESHAVALVLEALHAARSIMKSPYTARGGPWSSMRSLTAAALEDVRAVAKCRTLMAVHDVAQKRQRPLATRQESPLRQAVGSSNRNASDARRVRVDSEEVWALWAIGRFWSFRSITARQREEAEPGVAPRPQARVC